MKNNYTFTPDDQLKFAALTGDFNPIHIDPLAARRTQAGAPVVHGIHALLWLLDTLAESHPDLPSIATIKVRFIRMIYVGDQVEAMTTQQDSSSLRAAVMVDGIATLSLHIVFGPVVSASALPDYKLILPPEKPLDQMLEDITDQSGTLAFVSEPEDMERAFPHATRLLGAHRIATLGSTTLLVGMILPGLYSLYAGLSLSLCKPEKIVDKMSFRVKKIDRRFRLVQLEIFASGLSGSLETFARHPPVVQTAFETIAPLVDHNEFTNVTALIVGGSRGLGELTAKIIAAGGGNVIITYNVGEAAAKIVADDITACGGRCQIIPYDALQDADQQLSALADAPTDIYYFATPAIFRGKPKVFSQNLFDEFNAFYVEGFQRLVKSCLKLRPKGVSVFYPSSIAIDEKPPSMEEYIMSKEAGEKLCADIEKKIKKARIIVSRLPRLPTDQTATVQQATTADPLDTLLPIIRKLSAS